MLRPHGVAVFGATSHWGNSYILGIYVHGAETVQIYARFADLQHWPLESTYASLGSCTVHAVGFYCRATCVSVGNIVNILSEAVITYLSRRNLIRAHLAPSVSNVVILEFAETGHDVYLRQHPGTL